MDHLNLLLSHHERLSEILGQPILPSAITEQVRQAVGKKIAKMAAVSPDVHAWYTYWLIQVPSESCGVGFIGFKGVPDKRGEVEIGYGLDPLYQGKGYATEAARGVVAWAFGDLTCRTVVAPRILRTNFASNRVLEKIGMKTYERTEEAISWRIEREDS